MIVYVAASSRETDRAREAMARVREAGGTVAHDWIAQIEAMGGDPNRDVPAGAARALSLEAFRHLKRSDLLWLLFPQKDTIGAWIEVGGFLVNGRSRLIVSGGDVRRSIFLNGCAHRVFATDLAAALWLRDGEGDWVRSASRPHP